MAQFIRKALALLATGALMVGLLAYLPGDSNAATLTGGTYTYVLGGEEISLAVDPISRKDGLLVPVELFQQFDITVEGATARSITLERGGVTANLSTGNTAFDLNGQPDVLPTAPLRLNGRLFVPVDLLKHFGGEYSVDGTYLVMRDMAAAQPKVQKYDDGVYARLMSGRTFSNAYRTDTSVYATGEFTILTPDILAAENLNISFGTRARLQNLAQSNTLVRAKLSNTSFKSGALVTAGLYMVDSKRRQYDVSSVYDIGEGLVNAKLAPGADRVGVLIYPKLKADSGTVTFYYDNNNGTLGTVTNP